MTIAAGTINYQSGTAPVTGCGFSYSADEIDTALSGSVAGLVHYIFIEANNGDFSMLSNTLLPKLISGELRIEGAEKYVAKIDSPTLES